MAKEIKVLDYKVESIPVKIYRPEHFDEETKTVIHYHGWTSSVEKFDSYGKLLAQKGYQVILPELIHHGDRKKLEDSLDEMILLKVVVQSIDEYDVLLNYLVSNNLINKDKLVLTGHSMGGYIVNILRGLKENLISTICYNGIANIFDLSPKDAVDFEGPIDDAKVINRIKELDPSFNYQRYDGKRMFVLIGEKDEVVSPTNMFELIDKMKDRNLDISNIEVKHFEEATHDIAMGMVRKAISYIGKL